jgi:TolB-like protein/Flp pilus assembly protein TadD
VTDPSKAVFLSYASQDSEAASRICGALRQAGVEVWFDQSELRGGDVWDQKIRREIRDCTLFMPVMSANTASRHEGYFRLEWDLADQRTHMMARDRAFIVPVCLDATTEAGTDVPESFHRVQWTRLPDGNTPPAFTARIIALLGAPVVASSATIGPVASAAAATAATTRSTPRLRLAAIALATLAVVGLAYVVFERFHLSKQITAEHPVAAVVPAPAMPAIPEKSVAVLPFVDMSEKKDQEYFSDGLSEELIDLLTKVPNLRVPARTSSFYFKGKPTKIAEIGKELSVAHVLEGSVRKSGNILRITAQLIRVDSGYHVWSETYDRKIDDIFKIQDEIAGNVVQALKVSLLEGSGFKSAGTISIEAYNLYLRGRAIDQHATSKAENATAIEYMRRAIGIDPNFAAAWASLASMLGYEVMVGLRSGDSARNESRQAAQRALDLDSSLPYAHVAMARILLYEDLDLTGAERQLRQALTLEPNNGKALAEAALLAMARGQMDRAIELARTNVANDPVNPNTYGRLAGYLALAGRTSEALDAVRQWRELNPGYPEIPGVAAYALLVRGTPTDAAAALVELDRPHEKFVWDDVNRVLAYDALGRTADAQAMFADVVKNHEAGNAYNIGTVYATRGNLDEAFRWLDRAFTERDWNLLQIKVEPRLRNVRGDPRYRALLHKMNLPE